jgi:hypothetical protein
MAFGTFNITANGKTGTLVLGTGERAGFPPGTVAGTVFGENIAGFFDDGSQTLTFFQSADISAGTVASGPLTPFILYKGSYQLFEPRFDPASPAQLLALLAGEFETFPTHGAVVRFSWFAQMPII